jgi:uncharacterized protein
MGILNIPKTTVNISDVYAGKNSISFRIPDGFIFYEKLANTIHFGKEDNLRALQSKAEAVNYNPRFESDSLKKCKSKKLESLLLNVTESCNLSCSYCIYSGNYQNERTENNTNMRLETAKKAIDTFMPLSKNNTLIGFYGGEPLNNINLVRRIIDYVREAYPRKSVVFSMTTNFCKADKYARDLIENEISITMSLDGPKQVHDKYRRFKNGRLTYNKIIDNLKKFQEISPKYVRTHILQNVTCEDLEDLPEIVRFFQQNKQFRVSRISKVEPKGLIAKTEKSSKDSNVFSFASDYLSSIFSREDPRILRIFFDQKLKEVAIRSKKVMPEELMLNGCCYPSNRKLFVDTDGKFYMCEKFGRRLSIGNVNTGIDQQAINESIDRFAKIRNNYCTEGCWAQRLCNACIQFSKDPAGDISEQGLSQICDSTKNQILMGLANYVILTKENKKLLEDYIKSIEFK